MRCINADKLVMREIRDIIDIAISAVENQDKYYWHDLKKNPDDLPDKCDRTTYLIFGEYEKGKDYFLSKFYGYGEECQGYRECPQGVWEAHSSGIDVIAWREIEPFEGGDIK